jgi:hypothetical protein
MKNILAENLLRFGVKNFTNENLYRVTQLLKEQFALPTAPTIDLATLRANADFSAAEEIAKTFMSRQKVLTTIPDAAAYIVLGQAAQNNISMEQYKVLLKNTNRGLEKLVNLGWNWRGSVQDLTNANFSRGVAIPDVLLMSNGKKLYNYKWHIKENPIVDSSGQSYDTAYQTLFYIDDPRLTSVKTRKVNISISADCDLLTALDIDKYVTTSQGQVQITEITYDTNNNSLTIQGLL